jgi:hypothetical protein
MKDQNINLKSIKPVPAMSLPLGYHSMAGALASAILLTCLTLSAFGGSAPQPAGSHAFGKSSTEWQELYWRWFYGDVSIQTDANGNAAVGNVVLLALPNAPGDGTPGSLDITLKPGQAFVLPEFGFLGTSYTDGTPPDPMVGLSVFETLEISLTLDGVTIVDSSNVLDYYAGAFLAPEIPLNSPPLAAAIWFQGISIVHNPLSVGSHVIHLDVKNTQPVFGFISEYHNTWNVTVSPGK